MAKRPDILPLGNTLAIDTRGQFFNLSIWSSNTITFAFPTTAQDYSNNPGAYGFGELTNGFSPLSTQQANDFRNLFREISSFADITFEEVEIGADISVASTLQTSSAHTYLPNANGSERGDVWIANSSTFENLDVGTYAGFACLHEILHAVGAYHPHEIDEFDNQLDFMDYTVLSYNSTEGASHSGYTNEPGSFAQSPMRLDIAALQSAYGANWNHNSGDTEYAYDRVTGELFINNKSQGATNGGVIYQTIWDGGGTDHFDFSNFSDNGIFDLRSGGVMTFSDDHLAQVNASQVASGNVFLAYSPDDTGHDLIENLTAGNGNDWIVGNIGKNRIIGAAGNDRVFGLDGNDVLIGGDGNDLIRGGPGDDQIHAGTGRNIVIGGLGADRFVFDTGESKTIIRDFDYSEDQVILPSEYQSLAGTWSTETGRAMYQLNDTEIVFHGYSANELDSTIFTFA